MRNILILACLLLVLTASVVGAESWTTQMTTTENPIPYIDVVTTATHMGTFWKWTYVLTPKDTATGIQGVTITLADSAVAALVSNITATDSLNNPLTGWTMIVSTGSKKVYWQTDPTLPTFNPLNAGSTWAFSFEHPLGPSANCKISAQDDYGYSGDVHGPAVPEPMGIMVSIMGLCSLAGFRKLCKK